MPRRTRIAGAVLFFLASALLSGQARRRPTNPYPPAALRAVDDAYTARRAQAVSIDAARGVLANDFGAKKLIAILTATTQHGFLTFMPDGSFTYTNDGTEAAADTFGYKISDGTNDSLPATVTLTITNDAPPAAFGDSYAVANGAMLQVSAPGVLANDSDPAGLPLTAVVVTNPSHGLLTLGANGAFSYKHDGTSASLDSFTYRVSNGTQFSAAASVTLIISANVPPTVANQSYLATQDTPLGVAAPGVLSGAADADSAQLTAIVVTPPAHGALVLAADGSFTYTPAAGYSGSDSFTYQASDGVSTSANTGVASITILSPASANADSYSGAMNLPRVVPAPGVLGNDPSGSQILSYGAATGREQTTIGALTATAQGGSVALNADGGFQYNPPAGYAGIDTFRYVVGNSVSSTAAVVTMTLSAPPAAVADSFFAAQNTARAVAAPGVLANDTQNGAALAQVGGALHGALTLNADGSFLYVPTTGYTGPDGFTYSLTNAAGSVTASVALTVVAPPAAVSASFLNVGAVAAPGVLTNNTANSAAVISYGKTGGEQTTIGQPAATAHGSVTVQANGSFVYTPASGWIGSDTFSYVISNFAGSSTGTMTITTQPPPVAVDDAYQAARNTARTIAAPGVLANDTPNGLAISAFDATSTAGGTVALSADGSFTYTPATGFTGSDTFTYTIGTGALARTATVTMTVIAPPVAVNDLYGTPQNTTLVATRSVLANDTANGGTIISYGKTTGTEQTTVGQPTPTTLSGSVSMNADGTFTYTPPPGNTTTDSFRYVVSNFAGASSATVQIQFVELPVANDDAVFARNDQPTTFPNSLLPNDTPNGATAGPSSVTTMQGGSATITTAGAFTYTPPAGFQGTDSFVYTLTNLSGSDSATVTLTVLPPPVARDDVFSLPNTGGIISAPGVLANDDRPGTTTITGTTVWSFTNYAVQLQPDGSLAVVRPGIGIAAVDLVFTYSIRNPDLNLNSSATVTIHIAAGP
ncbi:MAG TPA: Ig-like domain-containing protein [Thermoanaerobaculia bacterium]|nr:Ig-like domain-containing protein [Thermoanaerobaculia bacterium]